MCVIEYNTFQQLSISMYVTHRRKATVKINALSAYYKPK